MKKVFCIISALCFCLLMLNGCGNNTKDLVGQWYNEKNKCLDIRSDGTWDLEGSYGTGTWKFLEDKVTVEFTDFYGDTQKSEIIKNDLGKYIDFGYYGDFYKDSYPSEEEISEHKEKNAISIDPFEGIQYEISGISPYCEIALNTGKCEETVQKYVKFELDKEHYSNGSTAIISATLSEETGNESYVLTSSKKEISVTGQPEYIDTVDGVDTTELKKELDDFVSGDVAGALKEANESFYSEGTVLGNRVNLYQGTVEKYSCSVIYLSSLKQTKELSYDNKYINKLTFVYSGSYTSANGNGNFYSCVSACNIVKYPDGTVKWGTTSNDAKDFIIEPSYESVEKSVTTIIMSNSSDYNITKVQL